MSLDKEIKAIDSSLRKADFRDFFELEQYWATDVEDLQEQLLRYQPHIVHFSGHGSQEGIVLESSGNSFTNNQASLVSANALSNLFNILKDNINCVILNSCYSETQAEAIAEHINCVIGMNQSIGDIAAINFSSAFYRAIGFGRSIKDAFNLGCLQIDLNNLGEHNTPQLIAHNYPPEDIIFTDIIHSNKNNTQQKSAFNRKDVSFDKLVLAQKQNQINELTKTLESEALTYSGNQDVHYMLGHCYLFLGLYKNAISCFNQAIELIPSDSDAQYYYSISLTLGKPLMILTRSEIREIEEKLNNAIRINSNLGKYHIFSAVLKHEYYIKNGQKITPPPPSELIYQAHQLPIEIDELDRLLHSVNIKDNELISSIKA